MQPKKGKYGLWYVDGVAFGFGTQEEALEHTRQAAQTYKAAEELKAEVAKSKAKVSSIEKMEKFNFLGYGWLEWAFSGVTAVGILSFLFWWNSDLSPDELAKRAEQKAIHAEQRKESDCKSETMHHVMSDEFIKDRLKSPSTAKFSSYGDSKAIYLGDCRVQHVGYVDAQNSFGAVVRNRYVSVTIYNKTRGKYTLESLEMLEM